jgi:hypothetical protein
VSDDSVRDALRSNAQLVVVEAPAGCGKTHQGSEYARELAQAGSAGRPLILTHTHAACSVFADRTRGTRGKVEIRTIDSVVAHIATAYHVGLGLPADTSSWVRQQGEDGYAALALRVSKLLKRHPMIAASLARRHPIVICDEHQDSSGDQHSVLMALHDQGARLRVFADPMQRIFPAKTLAGSCPPCDWTELTNSAQAYEQLDVPHRWTDGCPDLGRWTLAARKSLRDGGKVDLRANLPSSLTIVYAENQAKKNLDYIMASTERKAIDRFEQSHASLLVLTRHNQTARSFRAFFNRRLPLWEGHTRSALEKLVGAINESPGNNEALAAAVVTFMGDVGKGFSPTAFGNAFEQEVRDECKNTRKGKPAAIQELARCLVDDPSHRGISRMLSHLAALKTSHSAFAEIEIDLRTEFHDAIRLGDFENADAGLIEITQRRAYARPKPPARAISNIHKAKGLECDAVIVMPCDARTFPDKLDARCLLYVALTRAKKRLLIVLSREHPSPLFIT